MISYVVLSVVWSFLGFTVGYLIGRTKEARRVIVVTDDTPPSPPPNHYESDRKWLRGFGILLIIISIFTVAQAWYQVEKDRDTLRCQVQFNNAISEVLQNRTQYDDENRKALIDFLTTLGQTAGSEDPAEQAKALKSFSTLIESYQNTEQARKENPYPEVPTGKCD